MSDPYDPSANYDVFDPENIQVGELRQCRYFEGTWEVGSVQGDVFNGEPAGKLDGLILTRNDPPGELTQCQLVRQT